MKTITNISVFLLIFFASQNILAVTNYVSKTGAHVSPFTSWANAATNIQDAVDVALSNDTVLVNDGVYDTGGAVTPGYSCSNRVVITTDITVRGVNGTENTIILGKGPLGSNAVRGVYMSAGILEGFTVSNGHTCTSGDYSYDRCSGGVNMYGGNGVITNCTITGNSAEEAGGGAQGGTVNNCIISGNSAGYGGGTRGGTVNNCTISGNSAGYGGGSLQATVNNCTISGNSAGWYGGGTYGGTVNNCTISENSAGHYGGGTCESTVNDCTIIRNWASERGGGTDFSTLNNCTISRNSAGDKGGGTANGAVNNCTISGNSAGDYGGGMYYGTVNNCIIWGNSATISNNYYRSTILYSCSAPLPSGEGNITDNPQFVSSADFHLQLTSPCINAGTNLPYVYITTDLDGNPRLFGDRVDMGAYEYIPEPCLFIIYNLLIINQWRKLKS